METSLFEKKNLHAKITRETKMTCDSEVEEGNCVTPS